MFCIQKKSVRHVGKQKNVAHKEEKNQSIEIEETMTEIIEW